MEQSLIRAVKYMLGFLNYLPCDLSNLRWQSPSRRLQSKLLRHRDEVGRIAIGLRGAPRGHNFIVAVVVVVLAPYCFVYALLDDHWTCLLLYVIGSETFYHSIRSRWSVDGTFEWSFVIICVRALADMIQTAVSVGKPDENERWFKDVIWLSGDPNPQLRCRIRAADELVADFLYDILGRHYGAIVRLHAYK